jgi:hypothetical protein
MKNCINCGNPLKRGLKYCSNSCQGIYQSKQKITKWLDGEIVGHTGKTYNICVWVRKFLIEQSDNKCEKCGFNTTHPDDNKSVLEINHIDGDASNTYPDNLEVLCPNCHALTSTYKARNRDSCRNR